MYHSDSRFYLRSLPFVGAILVFFLTLYLFPNVVSTVIDYILHTDPEEYFSPEGWSLYALIIPFCIAGLSRFEDNWGLILTLLLFPPVLALSYWLWEVLAWVMFAILFIWLLMAFDKEDSYIGLIIAEVVYAICRVFGSFGDGNLDTIGDALFIIILGGYMLFISLVDTLYYKEKFKPSGISMLYILIMCITLLCLSGLNKSATTITKKVVQTTTVQKTICYCTASSGVNVRYTPASNSTIVGKLKHGQAVEVLEHGTSFTKISYKHSRGETAWVSSKYLSTTKPATKIETKKTTSNNSSKTTSTTTSKANTSSSTSKTTTNASSSKSSTSTSETKLLVDSKVSVYYKISSKAGQRIFAISTSASDYQIVSKPSWCTIIAKNKGTFEIKYEANPLNAERSGKIQVKAGDATASIALVQSAGVGNQSSNSTSATRVSSYSPSSTSSNNSSSTTTPSKGMHNGHEYVDLGLSVKWATNNMYGHYRFGEKNPRPTRVGNTDSYRGSTYSLSNDVARANWGGNWRLPTKSEFEELINKCKWTATTQGGVRGLKVTGSTGNSIFLPAAGYRHESTNNLMSRNEVGYYWSSTSYGGGRVWTLNIWCGGSSSQKMAGAYGSFGNCIRPVCR